MSATIDRRSRRATPLEYFSEAQAKKFYEVHAARPFYALHAGRSENYGFYTHAMIYSPEVQLFRDDDGDWLEPIPVDIVTSPGAPRGAANGNYRHGYWTREAVEERKFIRSLVKGTLVDRP